MNKRQLKKLSKIAMQTLNDNVGFYFHKEYGGYFYDTSCDDDGPDSYSAIECLYGQFFYGRPSIGCDDFGYPIPMEIKELNGMSLANTIHFMANYLKDASNG